MSRDFQSAVKMFVDQAVNKADQMVAHSIILAVQQGTKLTIAGPGNPSADNNPLAGALACAFTDMLNDWCTDTHVTLRRVMAERLLERADKLERAPSVSLIRPQDELAPARDDKRTPPPAKPQPPQPSTNGSVTKPLKGGLG